MNRFLGRASLFTAVVLAVPLGVACSSASAQTITEYAIPTAASLPQFITAAPYGGMWFTELSGNQVGRISTAGDGTVTEFAAVDFNFMPTSPTGIVADSGGYLWVLTLSTKNIDLFKSGPTPTRADRSHRRVLVGRGRRRCQLPPGPMASSGPRRRRPTRSRDLAPAMLPRWSSSTRSRRLGARRRVLPAARMVPSGSPRRRPARSAGSRPPAPSPNSPFRRWAASPNGSPLDPMARCGSPRSAATRSGAFPRTPRRRHPASIEFALPAGSVPVGIAAGPDGAIWFTEQSSNKIGRLTLSGAFTEYPIPTAASGVEIHCRRPRRQSVVRRDRGQSDRPPSMPPADTSKLLAATLPASRSVQVGHAATGFATLLNTGPAATGAAASRR